MNRSNISKPTPDKAQKICPVCGIVTYSRGGIHPQCASLQADAPRVTRLKAAKKVEKEKEKEKVAQPRALGHWAKLCPKCGSTSHVRKLICGCGHHFS